MTFEPIYAIILPIGRIKKWNIKKIKQLLKQCYLPIGKEVHMKNLMTALEISEDELQGIIELLMQKYNQDDSGIELIKVNESYQLVTKKEYYEYVYPLLDNRIKPSLSSAALETLSIIAYNPKITRSQIENIRGVSSDGTVYKLLEFELIESAGKMDAPGRPTMYQVTDNFLKMFGISNLDELPELPRYKLDENEQIVIDDLPMNDSTEKSSETENEDGKEEN